MNWLERAALWLAEQGRAILDAAQDIEPPSPPPSQLSRRPSRRALDRRERELELRERELAIEEREVSLAERKRALTEPRSREPTAESRPKREPRPPPVTFPIRLAGTLKDLTEINLRWRGASRQIAWAKYDELLRAGVAESLLALMQTNYSEFTLYVATKTP